MSDSRRLVEGEGETNDGGRRSQADRGTDCAPCAPSRPRSLPRTLITVNIQTVSSLFWLVSSTNNLIAQASFPSCRLVLFNLYHLCAMVKLQMHHRTRMNSVSTSNAYTFIQSSGSFDYLPTRSRLYDQRVSSSAPSDEGSTYVIQDTGPCHLLSQQPRTVTRFTECMYCDHTSH